MTGPPPPPMETASQTAGPYVHLGLMPAWAGNAGLFSAEIGARPAGPAARGERIVVEGRVLDGTGAPVRDALIETWQADAAGRFPGAEGADRDVTGLARFGADAETGAFRLETIRPGAVKMPGGGRCAPHLALWLVARGLNRGLTTRIYFEDDDHRKDPVLAAVAPPERARTLIAAAQGPGRYRFDIRLRGPDETVFLEI